MASNKSSFLKSGHNFSVKNNSEYAICHNKKLLILNSPLVRINNSGSGISAVFKYFSSADASTLSGHNGLYRLFAARSGKKANSIPPIMHNDVLHSTDVGKGEVFADYFASVFVHDNGIPPPLSPPP